MWVWLKDKFSKKYFFVEIEYSGKTIIMKSCLLRDRSIFNQCSSESKNNNAIFVAFFKI